MIPLCRLSFPNTFYIFLHFRLSLVLFCNSLSSLTVCWAVFLPSQPSFPFSFFSASRFSSHPAPACWLCEIQSSVSLHSIRGINNTLFMSNPAYRAVFVLLCGHAELKIGNFLCYYHYISKQLRCHSL